MKKRTRNEGEEEVQIGERRNCLVLCTLNRYGHIQQYTQVVVQASSMVGRPTYFSSSLPPFSLPPPVLSPLSILPSVLYLRLLLVSGSDRVNELQINGHDGFSWVHLLCSQVLHLLFWQALH